MLKNLTYRCFKLHYCANISLDKSIWDKYENEYKKENDKVLDILKIGNGSYFLFFDIKKIKEKDNQYHLQIDIKKAKHKKSIENIKLDKKKGEKVLEQSIKEMYFLQQKIRTNKNIQCHKGHLLASYYFEAKKFRSTVGIPFEISSNILGTEENIGKVTIESLGFAFKDSAVNLQKVRIYKGDKNYYLDFMLSKDIMIDKAFLKNLFDITNGFCPLFIEEIK